VRTCVRGEGGGRPGEDPAAGTRCRQRTKEASVAFDGDGEDLPVVVRQLTSNRPGRGGRETIHAPPQPGPNPQLFQQRHDDAL
jgi:hypothetical protein